MKNQNASFVKFILVIVVLSGFLFSTGCGIIRKNQINAELEKLEPQKEASKRRLNEINQKIAALQKEAGTLQTNIRNSNSYTMSYMNDHVIAVACMASVGYSIGKDNLFSEDVNDIINTSSFLCVLGVILSEDFRNDVINVVNVIESSDRNIKVWQLQISAVNSDISAAYEFQRQEKAVYGSLTKKIEELKGELAMLQ